MKDLIQLFIFHRRKCGMGRWESLKRAVYCWL